MKEVLVFKPKKENKSKRILLYLPGDGQCLNKDISTKDISLLDLQKVYSYENTAQVLFNKYNTEIKGEGIRAIGFLLPTKFEKLRSIYTDYVQFETKDDGLCTKTNQKKRALILMEKVFKFFQEMKAYKGIELKFIISGFSKGCIVMNNLFAEMVKFETKLWTQIESFHLIDSGNSYFFHYLEEGIQVLSKKCEKHGIHMFVHTSNYTRGRTMHPKYSKWKFVKKQLEDFISKFNNKKLLHYYHYYDDEKSLATHFRVLWNFKISF